MQFLEQKYYEDFIAKTVVGWKNSFQNFKTNVMVLCYTVLEHNTQKNVMATCKKLNAYWYVFRNVI